MAIAVGILSFLLILAILYISFLQVQLRNINKQLSKRLSEKTRQPITLDLFSENLNVLVGNINKCLKEEEILRIQEIRKEKEFKELIANISHDLRTPLTAIRGYQELISNGELSKEQMTKVKIAQKHAEELGKLIECFFEYSYLLNTELEVKAERINITNLVAEGLAEFINSFEDRGINVQFEGTKPVFILADREMVKRILRNLIGNCLVHSNGDIKVEVKAKDYGTISFINSVKNAKEIDIKRLFDRFYTADKSRSNSTGLGLSIVRLLTDSMGGSTSAELKGNIINISVNLPLF